MGGVMESLIKITKKCLKAALKELIVTEETLYTYLVEIENVVISHPWISFNNEPNDRVPLTPYHFLVGLTSPNQNFVVTLENINIFGKKVQRIPFDIN